MNIIKPKTVNFSELVKNSSTILSLDLQSELIDSLNEHFNEEEQRWFISNLYMYLTYNPTTDFPINLEDVYNMIGFSTKANTMKSIKKAQSQCRLYYLFKNQPINKLYNGIIFDKRETNTPDIYSYSVYLTEYKFTTTIKTRECEEKEEKFHLYLFNDATTLKQKIKLQSLALY